MKAINLRKVALGLFSTALITFGSSSLSNAQSFTEGFDDVATLTDWYVMNNSDLPSTTAGWGPGNPTIFPAYAGANTDSYLSCNYQSTTSTATNATISNWLFSPNRVFNNGDVISFWSRIPAGTEYPDRLQVRLSTSGNSTTVGTTPTSVGDFTTLLLEINPTLTTGVYPKVWTQYTITISGLSGPTSGRVAFRYFVTSGGSNGANSNYIGIDSYSYTSTLAAPGNNDCAGAALLTEGVSCTPTSGTIAGATASIPTTVCDGTANDDVWYRFVATSANTKITVDGSTNFDAVFEVFSGSCGTLTSMACQDSSLNDGVESMQFANLVVGQTYYVRVFDWYAYFPTSLTFTICVTEVPSCLLTAPGGSVAETETCGADLNGGCNSTTPVYQDITCGDVIFGSSWANNGLRDPDWYRFTVTSATTVNWNVNAEFPAALLFVNISNCASPVIVSSVLANQCTPTTLSYAFTPGTYVAYVAPAQFYGYPCGSSNDYIASLTMTTTAPVISAGGPTTFCTPGTVNLTSTGTGSFAWNNAGSPIGGATTSAYSAATSGSYTVQLTDANGCKSTSNAIAVTANPTPATPTITASGPATFCAGGSVTLTSSATTGNSWSTAESTQLINVGTSGCYTVIASAGGCNSPASTPFCVTVNPLDNAVFTYPTNSICDASPNQTPTTSAAGTFSVTPAGLTFVSTATGEIDVVGSTPGSYSITYSTSGTCPATTNQTVVISGNPDATFTYAQGAYCSNASNPSPVFGVGASAGSFSSTTGLVLNSSTGEINLASSAAGTYTVTNSIPANGSCAASVETFSVIVKTTPTATVSGGGVQCGTGTIPVTVALTGAGPWDVTYSDGTTSTTSNGVSASPFTINASANGTYTVSTVTMNGCSATGSGAATVVFNANPTVTFTPVGNLCDNGSVVTLVASPAGGSFTGSTGVSGTTFDPSGLTPGSITLTYDYTDANNCSGTASSTFTLNAAPQATLGTFTDVCLQAASFGLTGGLPAGGTYTGTGVTGGNFNPATAGVGTQAITYTVTANGCTDAASQSILVEDCAGIEEAAIFGLEIYPNPASSVVTIKTGKDVTFSMISEDGKVVYPASSLSMDTETQIQVSHLAKGIYFLHFTGAQGNLVQKVIVK
ncbi:choice-of-anchor J domain-containing protein [Fluviicola taffensis]|uniref:T9SS-dependent choice-of-anchor J family protein n=1 Tax=Fluviicola taffensis TaxID=191579 RepID=UPI0031377254